MQKEQNWAKLLVPKLSAQAYIKSFEGRLPVDSRTGQTAFRQNKMYGTSQSGDAFPPERDSALPNYNLTHFSTLSEIRKKTKKKKIWKNTG